MKYNRNVKSNLFSSPFLSSEEQNGIDSNGYFAKLSAFLPTEAVTGYIATKQIIELNDNAPVWIGNFVFFLFIILTPVYLRLFYKVNQVWQLILSAIIFTSWAITIGCPLNNIYEHLSTIALIFAIVLSTFSPKL